MEPSYDPKDIGGVIAHAFLKFLPIAGISIVFAVLWWVRLKRKAAREAERMKARMAERRASRGGAGQDTAAR